MYAEFFGLADVPFRLTPDPHYLYLSRKHAEALIHLRLGLKESDGFVCITGDVGTGKTTLLRAFLAELGPDVCTAYLFNPAVSARELVQRINNELGVPAAKGGETSELIDALNAHLLAEREAGRLAVVVVDEAQAFSIELLEQLRLLSNLETSVDKLLRVVLVGQPQLRTLLAEPALTQLNQRITLRWHMGPLSYLETVAYVRHRLAVASGDNASVLFSDSALRLLHRLSGGVPRLINMIAHRAMLAAFVRRRQQVTVQSVLRAYREIETVPLPLTSSIARRASWLIAAGAMGASALTLGVPRLSSWRHRRLVRAEKAQRRRLGVARSARRARPLSSLPASSDSTYEHFFGLSDVPFRLTPDPHYLFVSRKHAEALAHLQLSLKESSGFVCITGDVGTGKTTLLRAFLSDLGPDISVAYIFNPPASAFELVQRINKELGVGTTSGSQLELVDALNAHLLAHRKAGRLAVVVVDEAQAFSIELLEQLRLLSNLETTTEKLLRVVLVGQPQLRGLLVDPALIQLNQRITLRWHMGALSYHETAAYLRHRLAVAGGENVTGLFSTPALRLLYRLSHGVPRLINMIAHRAMLAAFVAHQRRVTVRPLLRAYREIDAVPLPRPYSVARRASWATAAAALTVGIATLGVPRFAWQPSPTVDIAASAPQPAEPGTGPDRAEPVEAEPRALDTPPAIPAPALELAAAPVSAGAPSAPAAASADSIEDLERRIAGLDPEGSARAAVDTILAAWQTRPLAKDENGFPDELEHVAWRRGLEDLQLNGNQTMLRLLDMPAVLELRVTSSERPRYAALTGIVDGKAVLTINGTVHKVDPPVLDHFWLGHAHVLWRDFETLGPTLGQEARGPRVARMQTLLRRAGAYGGGSSGIWDADTNAAVLRFQRSRRLAVDGRVGKFTRIVLYAAVGGYARPTLGGTTAGAS